MNDVFNPSRLAFARRRLGCTATFLAAAAEVSPRALAYYESGERVPDDGATRRLAAALDVPLTFFFAPQLDELEPDAASFRALSKMSARMRDAALASGSIGIGLNAWLEERMRLPEVAVPTYERGSVDPGSAAQRLRFEWNLGYARVANTVHLLEARGVRVFSLPPRLSDVDAFSFWWRGRPFVFLNTTKSYERGRFDAIYELAHLVLHADYDLPRGRDRELEANRFAAAFLMPEDEMLAARLRNANVNRILEAKERWGVSAMALTHRLHGLGITSDWMYATTCRRLSELGYRRGEPDGVVARESSQLLSKAVRLLRERGLQPQRIARDLHVHPEALNELLFGLTMTTVSSVDLVDAEELRQRSG
ncbi:ImmA/IrrE family metallo-endopeptidase [Nocardioides endophyticus]|uniref:ImmA/IrrE family metallo-endopeptidase n=1 Tax=Nocardioides endophyticus TaxID=1353775 RepID=A0ABP8Z735_9ACTN